MKFFILFIPSAQKVYKSEAQFFLSATLAPKESYGHRPLITVLPALTGAAITVLALAEPFIASGAAVGFIRCSLLFFKGAHGLVVPPRHGSFLPVRTDSSGRATEKELGPRGHERNEIINVRQLNPGTGKLSSILNKSSIH